VNARNGLIRRKIQDNALVPKKLKNILPKSKTGCYSLSDDVADGWFFVSTEPS
jgi:hypothetical protein